MKLNKLFDGIECMEIENIENIEIKGISINSKDVKKDDIFFCLNGTNEDGNKYISEARKKGAAAIVTDKNIEGLINVKNARKALSLVSKNFYNKACDKMKIIAITGTNGKTTSSYMVSEILKTAGHNVGVIGTNGAVYSDKKIDTGFTTPDPQILHKLFFDMLNEGVDTVVMEVSAHAIDLKKIEGIKFEVGLLTNITEDHLDYFKNMDDYALCKLSLLTPEHCKVAVLNADDKYGAYASEKLPLPVITYGIENPSDCFAIDILSNLDGTKFICNYFDEVGNVRTNFVGDFNVSNVLGAFCAAGAIGVPFEIMQGSLSFMQPVEGRFNILEINGAKVIIDFAHTPDGLEKILSTVKAVHDGRVFCLFGCGGNREKEKRPKMGAIAEKYCDKVFVTSDNPRFENPSEIIKEIESGMHLKNHEVIIERGEAIEKAIKELKANDALIIAGKGAEDTQEINGVKYKYNDYDAVYKVYKKMAYGQKKEGQYVL